MSNLLKKAKSREPGMTRGRIPYTKDEVALAVAFIKGDITASQYAYAMGFTRQEVAPHRIGSFLRHAYRERWIDLKEL